MERRTGVGRRAGPRLWLGLWFASLACVLGFERMHASRVHTVYDQAAIVRIELDLIAHAIEVYRLRNAGALPPDLQTLARSDDSMLSLFHGHHVPQDPWGFDYGYQLDPTAVGYRLWSGGADGRCGGSSGGVDIVWQRP